MDQQYRSAVLDSFIELENMIKVKTNYPKDKNGKELVGVGLMREVFNLKNPLLKWNTLDTQAQKDEYEGYSHIFAGVMQGIRNIQAHTRIQQSPYKSLQLIVIANLLTDIVKNAHKVND